MTQRCASPQIHGHSVQQLEPYLFIEQSPALCGTVELSGAKNAVLAIMASLILTNGRSVIDNVPDSDDIKQMIILLQELGAIISFDNNQLSVDTSGLNNYRVRPEIMRKMRASFLVMGPLIARFGRAEIALPGGDLIGLRPVDIHLKNFEKMGVQLAVSDDAVVGKAKTLKATTLVLDYPSVGATENLMMLACAIPGVTRIIHAAIEPEVLDLIAILKKMGAQIEIIAPATIEIKGVTSLTCVKHTVMNDRLEAGSLLLAAAITGGSISIPQADHTLLDVFLLKLEEMGHTILRGPNGLGIDLIATQAPRAVSFKTCPYPGFPTDLQAPTMAALALAQGTSVSHETVYENRYLHVAPLQSMGAQIKVVGDRAYICGVEKLYGTQLVASDIRGACALVLAGLAATGTTVVTGVHHWQRGYQALEKKLASLGAKISLVTP